MSGLVAPPAFPGRVYLVGFMGSGKTSAGRLLAERAGVPFVDLDVAFESLTGKTIRETFETRGEPWFREREAELLRGTEALPQAVVALGGGTFVTGESAAWISRHGGPSIFLDVPFETIAARLGAKSVDRPLFRSLEEAQRLYEARRPSYRLATGTVSLSGGESVAEVVERILATLSGIASPGRP